MPNCVSKFLGDKEEWVWIFQNSRFKASVKGPDVDTTEICKGAYINKIMLYLYICK